MPQNSSNINDIFFQGGYKEIWRKLIPPGLSEAECSFLEEEASLEKTDAVLDLMCGYGRHVLELARRGYNLTAIDNLPEYISEIKNQAAAENLPVHAFASGALEAELTGTYKAILCMGNSFAFFGKEDALSLLKKISAHLCSDGLFFINTWMIAEIAIRHFREHEWHKIDGYKYLLEYKYFFTPSRIESEHTVVSPEGSVEVIRGIDYIFTLDELNALFSEAGLRLRDVYSTPKRKPFRMGDSRAYLVIEKIS